MSWANFRIARSGRCRGPKTVKMRRQMTGSWYKCEYVKARASPAAFVAAYTESGLLVGSSSENGTRLNWPYTELEEAKTNRCTSYFRLSSNMHSVPSTLTEV